MVGVSELSYGGVFVLDSYQDGVAYLHAHVPSVANVFASPSVRRGTEGDVSVAWYGDVSGTIQKWKDCDDGSKARNEAILKALVNSILSLAADADDDVAQMLLRWLHVPSLDDDLLVVNGQPVLTNWGIVPDDIAGDSDRLWEHFRLNLGRYVTADVELSRRPLFAAQETAASPTKASIGPVSSPAVSAREEGNVGAPLSAFRCGVLPVAIACVAAFLILLLLLIPGILIYPAATAHQGVVLDERALAESEAVLRQRVGEMKALLVDGQCRAPVGQSSIGGSVLEALPQAPGVQSGAAPSAPVTPSPTNTAVTPMVLPPSPHTIRPQGAGQASSLVDLLEKSTVLVVGRTADGKAATGTGFFVTPDIVVTNRHVVEQVVEQGLIVINQALGGTRRAQLKAVTGSSDFGSADFALLQVEGAQSSFVLPLTTGAAKGENVLAAGFPSFFMETDSNFQALIQGEATESPSLVLTQGIVTVFQAGAEGVELVLHSADISPGNSGGPLVDYCGRVVGVNTFLRTNSDDQMRLNFALKTSSLSDFLNANGVAVEPSVDACTPSQVTAQQQVQAEQPVARP